MAIINLISLNPQLVGLQANDQGIQTLLQMKRMGQKPTTTELQNYDTKVRRLVGRWESLEERDGELFHRWEGSRGRRWLQWVVPTSEIPNILKQCHDNPTGGHFGYWKTLGKIRQNYFWLGMSSEVRAWCRTCTICRHFKGPNHQKPAPLQQAAVGAPFDRVGLDLLGPFPRSSRGNRYVMVVMDYFSKWPEAVAIRNQEAQTVAEALVDHVISRYGVPREIHTDQGRHFEAKLVKEVIGLLGGSRTRSTPLHPQSGGLVERLNRTLAKHMAMFVNKHHTDWDEKLSLFLLAYRSAPHRTTGFSPAQLVFGRDLCLPEMLWRQPTQEPTTTTAYAIQLRNYLEQIRNFARDEIKLEMRAQKEMFDRKTKQPSLQADDWVWVYTPTRKRGLSTKLLPQWTGPWVVKERKNDVLYKVQMGRKTRLLHANRLARADVRLGTSSEERGNSVGLTPQTHG